LFSKRHGFKPTTREIIIRHDAPYELRGVIVSIAYAIGFRPKTLRPVVCAALRKRPDQNNWSEYPNIDEEIHSLIDGCEWYHVYDIIENIYDAAQHDMDFEKAAMFEEEINSYFKTEGIGWQLVDGRVEMRGSEGFEAIVSNAHAAIEKSDLKTAKNEIHEAITDLSRRPDPDVTGAIQHSMAGIRMRRPRSMWG
jgi:hypothetical protein